MENYLADEHTGIELLYRGKDITDVPFKDIEQFNEVATELEVFNKGNPRQIGARIKRMFTRIGLDEMEVNFFRGFLGAVEKKLKNK